MASAQPFGRNRGYVYASAPRPPEDDWITVVAESFVALIEPGPSERGVDALAGLAQGGDVPLEQIVSAIPVGPDGVNAFAVAHCDEETDEGWQLTVVVRGRAVVDVYSVGGARRFTSSGVQPWLIATFRDVVATELGGPARRFGAVSHRAPSALAIGQGSAHAGGVLWSMVETASSGADDADAGYVRPAASLDDDTIRRIRQADPLAAMGRASEAEELTVERGRGRADRAHGWREPNDPPDREPWAHSEDAETGRGAVPRSEFEPAQYPGPDDRTVERASIGRARSTPTVSYGMLPDTRPMASLGGLDAAGADVDDPIPAVSVAVRGRQSVRLDAPIVIGRQPANTRRSGAAPVLLAVASPAHVISASHVRIERAGRVVVVTDLRSRNGTTVALADGAPRRLRPGESFAVPGAATVDIGDGTIIDITPVAP